MLHQHTVQNSMLIQGCPICIDARLAHAFQLPPTLSVAWFFYKSWVSDNWRFFWILSRKTIVVSHQKVTVVILSLEIPIQQIKHSMEDIFEKSSNESESLSVMSDSLRPHGLSPWNSPGQNTGVGSLSLLQGVFLTQGLNPGLPHCRQILYSLSHKGSPRILEWVAYPFSSRFSQPRNRTGVACIAGRFFTNWAKAVVGTP